MSKQWKKKIREKCKQIVNSCNECQKRFNIELAVQCENCMSRSRCELAKEILEEVDR